MRFSLFLEHILKFLETGNLSLPGKECQILDCAARAVKACRLFEREIYKQPGIATPNQYREFYSTLVETLSQVTNKELLALDTRSKDILRRNLDTVSEFLPYLSDMVADISTLLF